MIPLLVAALSVTTLMSVVIMYSCNSFEDAAEWLGRGMKPGVKGATINAVGSSLPELFTTFIFLFGPMMLPSVFGAHGSGSDHFSAAVATCAGSAVFNAVIIPALCILAVSVYGVKNGNGRGRSRVRHIQLNKRVVIKDGLFFVGAELLLIWFLSDHFMKWWMGGVLAMAYVVYIGVTLGFGFEVPAEGDDDDDDDDAGDEGDASQASNGILGLGWLLDINQRFFGGAPYTTGRAWAVLAASVGVIGIACGGIVWGVEQSAAALGVRPYFTAVILAAAATSVPDTVLSVKDAIKGQYDDAVANAVGSNIFDITICLGLPLFAYGLVVGDVELAASGAAADVQALRWVLLAVTAVVLGLLLFGPSVGRNKAIALIALYVLWTAFIIGRASNAAWTDAIVSVLPGQVVSGSVMN